MRDFFRLLAGLLLGAGLACRAFAQNPENAAPLAVERDAEAADCPDSPALLARIAEIRGPGTAVPDASRYTVQFSQKAGSYAATILSGADRANIRSIASRAPDCAALAKATAVTLALLFDADTPREAPAPVATPVATPALAAATNAPAARAPAEDTDAHARAGTRAHLSLGAGVLAGVVRPFAPALVAEAGALFERLRFSAGVLFVPTQTIALGPGNVSQTLVSGQARACYAPFAHASLRFDLCSGFLLGATHGAAHGYTDDAERTRLFTALPFELGFAQLGRFIGWELSATLLVPFRRNQFTIENVDKVYRAPAIAGLVSLRIPALLPL